MLVSFIPKTVYCIELGIAYSMTLSPKGAVHGAFAMGILVTLPEAAVGVGSSLHDCLEGLSGVKPKGLGHLKVRLLQDVPDGVGDRSTTP